MTAPNHALTGALIGLTISNPALALPLAFLSHLVCDAIPHYDPAERNVAKLFASRRFVYGLWLQATICGVLVLCLAVARPRAQRDCGNSGPLSAEIGRGRERGTPCSAP